MVFVGEDTQNWEIYRGSLSLMVVFKLYCAEEFPGCLFKHAGPQATAPEILFGKFGRVWAFVFFTVTQVVLMQVVHR